MSPIGGVLARRGGTVSPRVLATLQRALQRRGPDGQVTVHRPPVGMVFCDFAVDADLAPAARPFVSAEGDVLTFDGRLDNVSDLVRQLGWTSGRPPVAPAVVIETYRRWGITGFARLVGDFAFSLWDERTQCLILAADAMGMRPLYYCCRADYCYWSSRARPLLDVASLPCQLDEEYMADFLANRLPARGPFRGVEVLHGGHALVVTAAHTRLTRYWSFDPGREIRYRSDGEYEEHFRELFEEAVACRLRTNGPVFCELSGGVDSSAIACSAARLVERRAVEAATLHTATYVFPRSPTANESEFVAAVEAQIGRPSWRISDDEAPLLAPLPDALDIDIPASSLWVVARHDRLAQIMTAVGARVVLSGMGGDQLFWSQYPSGLPIADLIAAGAYRAAWRRCLATARQRHRSAFELFWRDACVPFLPPRLHAHFGRQAPVGDWLAPAFRRRVRLAERMLPMPDDLGFTWPTTRLQYGYIRRTARPFALECCTSSTPIEFRYPYLDRRLVEYALAIPPEQKMRPAESRSIVRRALVGHLPDVVRLRETKAGPEEAFYRAVSRQWPWLQTILAAPRLADLGIVDPRRFAAVLARARHGAVTAQAQLAFTIALELWIRKLECLPSSETPRRPAGGTHALRRRFPCNAVSTDGPRSSNSARPAS